MKDKPNKGWIKELANPPKAGASGSKPDPFKYQKPVNKLDKINSMAVNSRSREYKSVKQDTTTSFKSEQNLAKASHKGSK